MVRYDHDDACGEPWLDRHWLPWFKHGAMVGFIVELRTGEFRQVMELHENLIKSVSRINNHMFTCTSNGENDWPSVYIGGR